MISFKKGNFRIGEAELKCKRASGCDYYGNPQWDGFCSKCYKDIQKQRRINASPKYIFDFSFNIILFGEIHKYLLYFFKKNSKIKERWYTYLLLFINK